MRVCIGASGRFFLRAGKYALWFVFALGMGWRVSAHAQPDRPPEDTSAPPPSASEVSGSLGSGTGAGDGLDARGLSGFVDGAVRALMEADGLAGVTVSVVQGGQLVHLAGYGFATAATEDPVDPAVHLFRVGSISKTLTWVAVMQLEEAGKLDLDAPIDDYLGGFQVEKSFEAPISMRHLMTHTPGFEDRAAGHLFVDNPRSILELRSYLESYRPKQVRAPGTSASYSNYGVGLAQLAVESITGEPFEGYAESKIFGPLGMERSTLRDPMQDGAEGSMPSELSRAIATGYIQKGGRPQSAPFAYIQHIAGVGGLWTTAKDMAAFMQALLGDGSNDSGRILQAATVRRMRTQLYPRRPELSGWAYGFRTSKIGRYQTLEHGGATVAFMSNMVMIPGLDLGVFVSVNSAEGRVLAMSVPRLLARHLVGDASPPARPGPGAEVRGEKYVGTYMTDRRAYWTFEKAGVLGRDAQVTLDPDGYLVMSRGGTVRAFVETSTGTYREAWGDEVIAFEHGPDGTPSRMLSFYGSTASSRIHFIQGSLFFGGSIAIAALLSMTSLLFAFARQSQPWAMMNASDELGAESPPGWATWAPVLASLLTLGLVVSLGVTFSDILGGGHSFWSFFFTYPNNATMATRGFAFGVVLISIVMVLSLKPIWSSWTVPLTRRFHHLLFTLALVALSVALVLWNFVGIGW